MAKRHKITKHVVTANRLSNQETVTNLRYIANLGNRPTDQIAMMMSWSRALPRTNLGIARARKEKY